MRLLEGTVAALRNAMMSTSPEEQKVGYICADLCGICISLGVSGVTDTLMPK